MAWQSIVAALRRKRIWPPSLSRQNSHCRQPDPFFTLSFDPFCTMTLDGRMRRVNPAFTRTLGYREADLLAMNFRDLAHADDRAAVGGQIEHLAGGIEIADGQARFQCADGSYKWLVFSSTPLRSEGLAYTVLHDQTRRKRNEEALRLADARCTCALEDMTDAYFAVDREWRLIRLNQQAERLWGRTRAEVLGRGLWEVFPDAVGGPFYAAYERVMQTGTPTQLEEYYPYPPHNRWFEVHAYRSPEGLSVFFRDATDRHQSQERIKRSLREKEVLLREVHHRVKNNLQVICSMLRLQARSFQDETLRQALRVSRERVLAMALLHDQLHRAKDLSQINLGEYIRTLSASLFCSYGVNSAEVALDLNVEDITVPMDTAIPCGLIVNELVSNSLRHAFPEGKGRVTLGLHARLLGQAELRVCDDGLGVPEGKRSSQTRSLGLWLVDLLAEQIGASVERTSVAGTAYQLVFQTTGLRRDQSDEQAPDHDRRG